MEKTADTVDSLTADTYKPLTNLDVLKINENDLPKVINIMKNNLSMLLQRQKDLKGGSAENDKPNPLHIEDSLLYRVAETLHRRHLPRLAIEHLDLNIREIYNVTYTSNYDPYLNILQTLKSWSDKRQHPLKKLHGKLSKACRSRIVSQRIVTAISNDIEEENQITKQLSTLAGYFKVHPFEWNYFFQEYLKEDPYTTIELFNDTESFCQQAFNALKLWRNKSKENSCEDLKARLVAASKSKPALVDLETIRVLDDIYEPSLVSASTEDDHTISTDEASSYTKVTPENGVPNYKPTCADRFATTTEKRYALDEANRIYILVSLYRNQILIHIRKISYNMRPTKIGVTFDENEWKQFSNMLFLENASFGRISVKRDASYTTITRIDSRAQIIIQNNTILDIQAWKDAVRVDIMQMKRVLRHHHAPIFTSSSLHQSFYMRMNSVDYMG